MGAHSHNSHRPPLRDGAGSFEMMVRLQKMLALLHRESRDPALREALARNAAYACERATAALPDARDQAQVQQLYAQYFGAFQEAPLQGAHIPNSP